MLSTLRGANIFIVIVLQDIRVRVTRTVSRFRDLKLRNKSYTRVFTRIEKRFIVHDESFQDHI